MKTRFYLLLGILLFSVIQTDPIVRVDDDIGIAYSIDIDEAQNQEVIGVTNQVDRGTSEYEVLKEPLFNEEVDNFAFRNSYFKIDQNGKYTLYMVDQWTTKTYHPPGTGLLKYSQLGRTKGKLRGLMI
jgi:hypothetical protein